MLAQSSLEAREVGQGCSLLFKVSESRNGNEVSQNLFSPSTIIQMPRNDSKSRGAESSVWAAFRSLEASNCAPSSSGAREMAQQAAELGTSLTTRVPCPELTVKESQLPNGLRSTGTLCQTRLSHAVIVIFLKFRIGEMVQQ